MYEFITQYLRIENNEKSYNNKKLKIKNLKNYKTHKKLFTYLKNLNRNINESKTSQSSLSSSTLSIDVYRQNEEHHYTKTKIHHINKINDNNNNNNLNINKNYYSKCYYRTNCDLYYILIPLIILIIFLITITNCNSEFHLNKTNSVNFNLIYNKLVKSHSNKTILLNYNYNKNNKINIKNFNTNNYYNDINLKNFSNVQLLRNIQMKSSSKNFINITDENLNSINYNNNSNNIMNINNNSNLNQFVKRLIKNTTVDTKQKRHKHFLNNYDSQKNVYDYNTNSSKSKNNNDDNDDEENDFLNYSNYDKMIKNNNNLHDYYYFQNFKKRNQLLMNSLNMNSSRRDFPMNLNEQNDEIWNMNTSKNYHYFNKNLKNYDDNFIDDQKDIEKLQQLVLQGLGLTKLPDVSKINISQNEYITKYNEYMLRVKERKQRELLLYNNLEYLDEIKSPKILTTYIHNSSDSNLYLMNYLYPKYFKNFKLNKYIYSNLNDNQLITKNKISNNRRRRRRQKRSSSKRNYNENTDNDSFSHGVSSSSSSSSISLLPSSASISTSSFEFTSHSEGGSSKSSPPLPPTSNRNHDIVYVRFPIKVEDESSLSSSSSSETDVEEANLRLLLIKFKNKRYHSMYDENLNSNYNSDSNSKNDNDNINKKHSTNNMKKKHTTITIKVYQLIEPYDRIWLDSRQIHVDIDTDELLNDTDFHKTELSDSQWLEFDVTKAVDSWINGKKANLGLEIHCEQCTKYNVKILHDTSIISNYYGNLNNDEILSPVLNIIGHTNNYYNDDSGSIISSSSSSHNKKNNLHERGKRSRQNHNLLQNVKRKPRKTDCYEENKKCCRHSMEVVFKEIKGFEFIIQPKVFDAGYCRGKCPPRYNPAHHHALLQSLIWKQDKSKAPRPCCAPSKLVELEVLHVDEKDPKKLKVSTWTDMRALECACS